MTDQFSEEHQQPLHSRTGDSSQDDSQSELLERIGLSPEELFDILAPAIAAADSGHTKVWDKKAFLKRMHEKRDAELPGS
ncbi:hypothetical protein [Lacunimicrobium album]